MVRLVQLQRIRVSNIDTMMRMMPYYFRPEEAAGLDFTCQFELTGPGGGEWVLRVADERCNVVPASPSSRTSRSAATGRVFLGCPPRRDQAPSSNC